MAFYISRYKNKASEEFDIEVVTPMFLGGANPQDAELRVPSIKGMLRFWWRATCGIESQKKMREEEAEIFGSTDNKAAFHLQIDDISNVQYQMDLKEKGRKFKVHNHPVSIIDYLAYGTHKYQKGKGNVYEKVHIKPGSLFTLKFIFYNNDFKNSVLDAFSFFTAFGGLGARSRNGFGSLYIKNLKVTIHHSLNLNEFSSISNKTKLYTFSQKTTWVDALSEIGMAYRESKLSVEPSHSYIKRQLVVAPITVKKKNEAALERHAKPYFLHVTKLDNGKFQGQILFMPYKYLSGHKNYSQDKLKRYQDTCTKMNEKLDEISGGAK